MKKIIMTTTLMLMMSIVAMGQARKPSLMVLPSNVWCNQNGCMTTFNNQGVTEYVPDYAKAFNTNADLSAVVTKIGGLMADRGFPLKSFTQGQSNVNNSSARRSLLISKTSGARVAESPLDRLMNTVRPDIRMEVEWTVSAVGPKKQVRYVLRGIDAYTGTQVAEASGVGPQSFSADLPVLLEEAVIDKMDGFCSQLQSHFDDMAENGRAVRIEVLVFEGVGIDLETEYGGKELIDVIEDWLNDNTVSHRYHPSGNTETVAEFDDVRIPLFDNNRPIATKDFARKLVNHLKGAPYNITCKLLSDGGLGMATIVIGEK